MTRVASYATLSRPPATYAGLTMAGVYVVRMAAAATKHSRWLVRATCGHEWIVGQPHLSWAHSGSKTLVCVACKPVVVPARRVRRRRSCSLCGNQTHTRATCKFNVRSKRCETCCGLPHRRPLRGACGCGGARAPDIGMTATEAMRMAAPEPREVA